MRTKYHWFQDETWKLTMETLPGLWVFSDGGIIGKNNAVSTGIVYAFVIFQDGVEVYRESDCDMTRKTSNQAEIWAAYNGVLAAQFRFPDTPINLVVDSGVTFQRIQEIRTMPVPPGLNGETAADKVYYAQAFKKAPIATLTRVSGHPPVKCLKANPGLCAFIETKDQQTLWHRHNVLVDTLCKQAKAVT